MKRKRARVENATKQTVLATKARIADTFWTRLKGLIGQRGLDPGEGLVIVPCKGVHMWFMRFPIDVVYVDKYGNVVDVDENLRPWSIGRPRPSSRFVVELPVGTVAKTATEPGDRIVLAFA